MTDLQMEKGKAFENLAWYRPTKDLVTLFDLFQKSTFLKIVFQRFWPSCLRGGGQIHQRSYKNVFFGRLSLTLRTAQILSSCSSNMADSIFSVHFTIPEFLQDNAVSDPGYDYCELKHNFNARIRLSLREKAFIASICIFFFFQRAE